MSLVEFKKKKKPKNRLVIGIAVCVILLIILGITRNIFGIGYRTTTAEPDILLDKIDGTGLVIKSENVYDSSSSGSIEFLKEEGSKVAVGEQIISVTTGNKELVEQLEILDKQIQDLGIDYYSDEENVNILEIIQEKINQENYNDIYEYLEGLDSGSENLIGENLESLLIKREELVSKIESSRKTTSSNQSGILSYEVDGYEEVLKPQDFESYKYDSLELDKVKENLEKKIGFNDEEGVNSLYKIIYDYVWFIAFQIDNDRILEFDEGQVYTIRTGENESLRGRIVAVNLDKSKGVIVIEFRDKLHEYYNKRIIDLSLIVKETRTYKIPSQAIVEKDGQVGVYINHIYGIVRFVPVNIVKEEEKITHISRGNNDAYITIEGEEVKTVTQFDEIFLNPSNIEEEQILR